MEDMSGSEDQFTKLRIFLESFREFTTSRYAMLAALLELQGDTDKLIDFETIYNRALDHYGDKLELNSFRKFIKQMTLRHGLSIIDFKKNRDGRRTSYSFSLNDEFYQQLEMRDKLQSSRTNFLNNLIQAMTTSPTDKHGTKKKEIQENINQKFVDGLKQINSIDSSSQITSNGDALRDMMAEVAEHTDSKEYAPINYIHTVTTLYWLGFDVVANFYNLTPTMIDAVENYQASENDLFWSKVLMAWYSLSSTVMRSGKYSNDNTYQKLHDQVSKMVSSYITSFHENNLFHDFLGFTCSRVIIEFETTGKVTYWLKWLTKQIIPELKLLVSDFDNIPDYDEYSAHSIMDEMVLMQMQEEKAQFIVIVEELARWIAEITSYCQTTEQLAVLRDLIEKCVSIIDGMNAMIDFGISLSPMFNASGFELVEPDRAKLLSNMMYQIAGIDNQEELFDKIDVEKTSITLAVKNYMMSNEFLQNRNAMIHLLEIHKETNILAKTPIMATVMTYDSSEEEIHNFIQSYLEEYNSIIDQVAMQFDDGVTDEMDWNIQRSEEIPSSPSSKNLSGDNKIPDIDDIVDNFEFDDFDEFDEFDLFDDFDDDDPFTLLIEVLNEIFKNISEVGGPFLSPQLEKMVLSLPPSYEKLHFYFIYITELVKRESDIPQENWKTLETMINNYYHLIPLSLHFQNGFTHLSLDCQKLGLVAGLYIIHKGKNEALERIVSRLFTFFDPNFGKSINDPRLSELVEIEEDDLEYHDLSMYGNPKEILKDRATREMIDGIAKAIKYDQQGRDIRFSEYLF